ncbi:MAG: NAD(P)H-dependent oxidoreductase [Azospirillaceae bacterium]|nr:NAD(P)H-dependent oxidoreductase [Azospirillaceae bacterium]
MPILLHILASPRGETSHSRRIGRALVSHLKDVVVVTRDLALQPLPHPDRDFVEASLMAESERGDRQKAALALSERLIAELEDADLIVIDTPMHNFTVPSVLKAWIDQVIRPHRTFRTSPEGKIGLLRNRPVFLVVCCGGSCADGGAAQSDFLTPYLRHALATIGLRDLSVLRLEGLNRGPAAVERADEQASAWIADQVRNWNARQR